MRHLHAGRKLGTYASHRTAIFRQMTLAIIERDAIQTTPARAKEFRWWAEHVVTLAKRGDVASRRQIVRLLGATETTKGTPNRVRTAIQKIYSDLVPRFQSRTGGYTQIIRLAKRRPGDNSEICVIQYLPSEEKKEKGGKGKAKAKAGKEKGEVKAKSKKGEEKHADHKHDHKHDHDHGHEHADKPAKAKKKEKEDKE